jgi:tetratricopeptide (TPR) repeat protein
VKLFLQTGATIQVSLRFWEITDYESMKELLSSWKVCGLFVLLAFAGCDHQASRLAVEHGLRWGGTEHALPYFNTAIELDPTNTQAYAHRGYIRAQNGPYDLAVADLQKAVELDPEGVYHYEAHNGLAWLLCTCNEDRIRDGEKAVKIALQACKFCKYENEDIVDTLAAAYAETGDFKSAVEWQQKAIEKADPERDRTDKIRGFYKRLQLYKEGIAYRE